MRYYAFVLIFIVSFGTAGATSGRHGAHWVALFPASIFSLVDDEIKQTDIWSLDVYNSSNEYSIGRIETRGEFNVNGNLLGVVSFFIPAENPTKTLKIEPHLTQRDTDLFHITLLDVSGKRAKVQFSEELGPVWISPSDQFADYLSFGYLSHGLVLKMEGKSKFFVVEYVNDSSLIVRDQQSYDTVCDVGTVDVEPYTTWKIPKEEWILKEGKSAFSVQAQGC